MTPKGGRREGAGRPPLVSVGKKVLLYLSADLVDWWKAQPARTRAKFVNDAIREKIERGKEWEENQSL